MESCKVVPPTYFDVASHQNGENISFSLAKILPEVKNIFLHGNKGISFQALETAIDLNRFETIIVEDTLTIDYFDLQRVLYKQRQAINTRVFIHSPLRQNLKIQELKQNIDKAVSRGVKIISISVQSGRPLNNPSNSSDEFPYLFEAGVEEVELILYLTQKKVTQVATTGEKIKPSFLAIAGNLSSEIPFSLQLIDQNEKEGILSVQVILSTGETLSTAIKTQIIQFSNDQNRLEQLFEDIQTQEKYLTLENFSKALRVTQCAFESMKTGKSVILKYIENGVIPAVTIGTAAFLDIGFFIPSSTNKALAVAGLYSARQEKIKEIFNRISKTGEPLEFLPSYEKLMDLSHLKKSNSVIYIPSIPGKRKDQEMIDALKAGYYVIAEKPAFANADLAKSFLTKIDPEFQKRLFFGWHYQHHYVFKKVWRDVSNKTYGNIKHVRAKLVVPMILNNTRIFEPSQGGAGIDIYCYPLHYTLRLIGFNHTFEVTESKIKSAQDLDPSNPILSTIDFTLDTKIKFGNGITADLFTTFDSTTVMHSEAEIFFEDGTKIFVKSFGLPQNVISTGFKPVYIQKVCSPRWEDYITKEDLENPEYYNSTYYQQIEFMRRQAAGEETYDFNVDIGGLGMEANIKLHEIIDAVFEKGGFAKKVGA